MIIRRSSPSKCPFAKDSALLVFSTYVYNFPEGTREGRDDKPVEKSVDGRLSASRPQVHISVREVFPSAFLTNIDDKRNA